MSDGPIPDPSDKAEKYTEGDRLREPRILPSKARVPTLYPRSDGPSRPPARLLAILRSLAVGEPPRRAFAL